jgi:hypothetical protein
MSENNVMNNQCPIVVMDFHHHATVYTSIYSKVQVISIDTLSYDHMILFIQSLPEEMENLSY